jgi:hypothetical protein
LAGFTFRPAFALGILRGKGFQGRLGQHEPLRREDVADIDIAVVVIDRLLDGFSGDVRGSPGGRLGLGLFGERSVRIVVEAAGDLPGVQAKVAGRFDDFRSAIAKKDMRLDSSELTVQAGGGCRFRRSFSFSAIAALSF